MVTEHFKPKVRRNNPPDPPGTITRVCRVCHEEKHLDDYPTTEHKHDGNVVKSYKKRKCRACDSRRRSKAYHADPEQTRWNHIESKYKVTKDQWLAQWALQDGRCGCCGAADFGKGRNWQTEHCHSTGEFRGIVCLSCNVMIGAARDSIRKLELAIAYLCRGGACIDAEPNEELVALEPA